jgi:DNA-binding LytR/AlgR family response regulator
MNCIIVDDDEFVRKDLERKIQQTVMLNLVGSYESGMEASQAIVSQNVDLIFLDVIMPEMSGVEFIQSLTMMAPEIVMISGDAQNAVLGFDYDVTDFLVKPVTYDRFLVAVAKAKRNHDKKGTVLNAHNDHIFIKVSSKLIKVELKKICYVEAMADYITIYTDSNRYTILSTMKRMEETLSDFNFLRVHNSYIINVKRITSIENQMVTIGKISIPISRNRYKNLMNFVKLI